MSQKWTKRLEDGNNKTWLDRWTMHEKTYQRFKIRVFGPWFLHESINWKHQI